jgi:hypothetical protein
VIPESAGRFRIGVDCKDKAAVIERAHTVNEAAPSFILPDATFIFQRSRYPDSVQYSHRRQRKI